MNAYKTTRIWTKTLQTLKRVAAETGETIVALIDRLAETELQRVRNQDKSDRIANELANKGASEEKEREGV
jgi:hypothetical protein